MIEWLMADAGVNNLFLCGMASMTFGAIWLAQKFVAVAYEWKGLYERLQEQRSWAAKHALAREALRGATRND